MVFRALAPLLAVAALVSCRTRSGPGSDAGLDVPAYEVLAAAHNDRVTRIDRISARGVIELWWEDDDGRHFEQGEADFWMALPRRTALNISKVGHRFMWIGSDDTRTWLFDFRDGITTLHVNADGRVAPGSPLPFEPTLILDLGGLTPLPETGGSVRHDAQHDAWVVTAANRPILFLDVASRLPVRAELHDDEGDILLYSAMKLSRYERVAIAGASPLAGPLFPTLVNIKSADDQFAVQLSARRPSDSDVNDNYFDLGWLKGWFKPDKEL